MKPLILIFGLTLAAVSNVAWQAMFLAQVGFSTTEVIAIATALLGALTTAVVFLFRTLMSAKDKELERANKLAEALVSKLEDAADMKLTREHKQKLRKLAPVLADSNSPPTPAAQKDADKETLKARAAAAVLALGLDPIKDPGMPDVLAHDEVQITGVAKITEAGAVKVKAEGTKPKP